MHSITTLLLAIQTTLSAITNNSCFLLLLQLLILSCNDVHPNPGPNKINDISVFHLNIRSLKNKISFLENVASDYDVVCVTETHLDTSTVDADILLSGYDLYRKDRETPGGGVAVYTSSLLCTRRRVDLEFQEGELIWTELQFPEQKYLLCTVYRPPQCALTFWNYFRHSIETALNETSRVVIVGDINVDLLTVSRNHAIVDILDSFHLSNIIDRPTRVGRTSSTLLDPIILSDTCNFTYADIIDVESDISDHKATTAELTVRTNFRRTFDREIRCYNNANYDLFNSILDETDWVDFFANANSPDDMCNLFTTRYLDIARECIPTRTVTIRSNDKPWFDSTLRKEIRKRNRLLKLYKSDRSDRNLSNFRKQRNHVNNLKKRTKELFYVDINGILDRYSSSNPRNFWKIIRKLIKTPHDSNIIPPIRDIHGNIEMSDDNKANILNDYFVSISTIDDNNFDVPTVELRTDSTISDIQFETSDITDILKSLNINKAVGNDTISHNMLKNTANSVALQLSIIFRASLETGVFPKLWKHALVTPLFKSGDKHIFSNYRPISLLSTVGKVFERLIVKYLNNYLLDNSLIYKFQSGFQPGHSTVHQLIEIYHTLCENLEKRHPTCLVFCDISKAFDRVWHKGLEVKLANYGISGKLLNWLLNYISERKQQVCVGDSKSLVKTTNAGVPQGSVLGPLLFILYINDISDNLQSLSKLFADDTSLLYSNPSPQNVESVINNDLEHIQNWANKWLVKFNPSKTEALLIHNSELDYVIDIKFDNVSVNFVENHRHLGVILDGNCKWTSHIDGICKKVSKQISVLRKLKYILNRHTLYRIYTSYIIPLLEYCCEVWDGCSLGDSDKLEKLQLEAARVITGLPSYTSIQSLYSESGLEPLAIRRSRRKLQLFL
ncbi:hypothetical protein CI610_03058 [invertebrate metagenome]|uniref:Reverse transcriptase domain-containing protein n=1 Tax=invertebrate metagenome TaxID=1711999 RepID=A0A2H9T462_9ZZZZ